jgi:hypothetical protein
MPIRNRSITLALSTPQEARHSPRETRRLRSRQAHEQRKARELAGLLERSQPRREPPQKHSPMNSHLPGSIALQVLGARIVR